MAYTQNEKSTGLDALASLAQNDLHIVGDVSDSGRAKAITEANLEDTIAASTNFVDELVGNPYFTTQLANDGNFITELTSNATFQTDVNNFVTGGGGGAGGGATIQQTFLFSDFVDDGSGNGIASFSATLPLNAIPIGAVYEFTSAFDPASVMQVVNSQAAGKVIGAEVAADATGTLVGEADGSPATFDFNATPSPVVLMTGTVPTMGSVTITVSYGAGAGGTTFIALASENLTAGQTVGISALGGGVARALRGKAAFSLPDTASYGKPVSLGGDRFFMLYLVNGSTTLKGIVGTVNRDTMTVSFGSAVTYTTDAYNAGVHPNGYQHQNAFDACFLDTDKVAVMYSETAAPKDVKIHVSTIAVAVITANAAQSFVTRTNNLLELSLAKIDTDKAAVYTGETTTLNPLVTAFDVSGTTLGTVGTGVTSIEASRIESHDTDAFTLLGNQAGTARHDIQVGTVATLTVTLGALVTLTAASSTFSSRGLAVIDSTHVAVSYSIVGQNVVRAASIAGTTPTLGTAVNTGSSVASQMSYDANGARILYNLAKAYTISGTTLTLQATIDGTGYATVYPDHLVQMGSYYAVPQVATAGNFLTVEGMAGSFLPGIASQNATRAGNATVLVKGANASQSGLVAGQKYTADGTGGLVLDAAGSVTALSSTSVVL